MAQHTQHREVLYPPADAWQTAWAENVPSTLVGSSLHVAQPSQNLARPSSAPWPISILRSSQLDAERLDTELLRMLKEQLLQALSMFNPGSLSDWEPELNALLRLVVFGVSVFNVGATPGSQLLNLRYRSETSFSTLSTPAMSSTPSAVCSTTSKSAFSSQSSLRESSGSNNTESKSSSTASSPLWMRSGASAMAESIQPGSMDTNQPSSPSIPNKSAAQQDRLSTNTGPANDAPQRVAFLGGKTGVDGPDLSTLQKVAVVAGMVLIPYAWSKATTYLARASAAAQPTVTWSDLHQDMYGDWAHVPYEATPSTPSASTQDQAVSGLKDRDTGHERTDDSHVDANNTAGDADSSSPNGRHGETSKKGGVLRVLLLAVFKRPWTFLSSLIKRLKYLLFFRTFLPNVPMMSMSGSASMHEHGAAGAGSSTQQSPRWHDTAWRVMKWAEAGYRAASVFNMMAFLAGGRYRSLLERLLGARLVYVQPVMTRIISFEYLNRQLVWQEISEVLLFLLPLLDSLKNKRVLRRLLPRLPDPRSLITSAGVAITGGVTGAAGTNRSAGDKGADQPQDSEHDDVTKSGLDCRRSDEDRKQIRPVGPCPICRTDDMVMPVVASPCQHVFCYYCLASHTAANVQYECPCDGERVAGLKHWRPGMRVRSTS